MMPKFETDFEYDEWFEEKLEEQVLDDYFGEEKEDDRYEWF